MLERRSFFLGVGVGVGTTTEDASGISKGVLIHARCAAERSLAAIHHRFMIVVVFCAAHTTINRY